MHVGERTGNGIYSVLTGRYAHFAHCLRDGGFSDAFAVVDAWVKESGSQVRDFGIQFYDRDFDPEKKDSILHIYIPLNE